MADFSIDGSAIGLQDVIVIATLSVPGEDPQDFVFLEQPGLSLERGDAATAPSLRTPAGQMLSTAAFGRGVLRGSAAADLATYTVHRLSWTVRTRDASEP